jgi:hypothetical protein
MGDGDVIPYTSNMPQCATYWPPGGNDGMGGKRLGPPQQLACRWQDVAQLFRTPEGVEVVSQAVVYTSQPVANGGRLLLGHSEARVPPVTSKEVRQVNVSPSLDGAVALHKAFL